jgi:hypothetical protein
VKVTDAQRFELVKALAPVVAGFKLLTTPPAKDGTFKDAEAPFAAACWTQRYVDSLVYVLEKQDQQGGDATGGGGASAKGFPR